jgi:virginiamycin B lyase
MSVQKHHRVAACIAFVLAVILQSSSLAAQQATATPVAPTAHRPHIVRPGVNTPGVSRSMADIKKDAVFTIPGSPDWSVVTADSLWVTTGRDSHIVQLVAATNAVGKVLAVKDPCSGVANAFGSLWSPSCGDHVLTRFDPADGKIIAQIPADPANSEGGITVGAGSIWLVIKPSTLVRIDPSTNAVIASIPLPSGSENPLFSDGFVWISSFEHNALLKVDPDSASVVATISIGPKPRFLTTGAGSIWTLNQGDGTVSRVDEKTGKLIAAITCGVPGQGGEITFGAGHVWVTMFDFPITEIDPANNKVVKQWSGPGGDGLRFGLGSLWLSNGRQGTVWRLSPDQP